MIIDSHAHVVLPTAKQIGLMAEAGVERTVLFSTIVHPEKCGDMQSLEKEMSILGEILAGVRNNLESTVRSIEERRLGRLVLRPNGGMVSPGPGSRLRTRFTSATRVFNIFYHRTQPR